MAQAVCSQLSEVLGAVSPASVWLVETPKAIGRFPEVMSGVWQVVCLAALSAMEFGRKSLWAKHLTQVMHPGPSPERLDMTVRVAALARDKFWFLLSDFCQDHPTPPSGTGWLGVGPDHPFLCVVEGSLSVSGPVAVV